ncbi:MAG TPA: hypothetical protein PK228_09860 [Saprospiraceae bacterium]|nr:hypothetical protein [Saprospiraceae bacterium]
MKHLSTLLLAFAFVSSAFAQTTNQVVFSFDHKAGADPMVLNQTEFAIWNNKKVKLTRAEFYISEIEIHHSDSTTMPLTDEYILVNAANPGAEHDLGQWAVDAAHGVTLHLGVPQSVNHNDPAAWPATHPLAPQNPSMHWGWSAGYRFMAIEGKIDNNNDGVPETTFEFHNLGDALYKTVELTGIEEAENGVLHLHLTLDYIQLFKNMAMTGNLIQHGSATLNQKMMTNAATEAFLAMPEASATHEVLTNSLNVSASPNPFSAETLIQYELPAADALSMIVTNSLGQVVRTLGGLPATGSLRFERGDLPNGIYQYGFYDNGNLLARKQFVISQ